MIGVEMDQQHFAETGKASFFGDYVYDQIVAKDHFLRKLLQVIDWKRFSHKLIRLYKGEGMVGRPPFEPALILKVELIAYLYRDSTSNKFDQHFHLNG